jgi:3-oxoacyl-[acyl-carrier protein] reductase
VNLGLKGKKAVVSGGTRGIGRAIAETFAAEGADVAICARNADAVAATVAQLRERGVNAYGASVDVSDGAALKAWIARAAEELGGIDVLVSNPGAMVHGISDADWEANFRVDVLGAVRAFDAAKPFLERAGAEHGDASIVFISTVSSMEADREASYGAVKAVLPHLAKGIAREYPQSVSARTSSLPGRSTSTAARGRSANRPCRRSSRPRCAAIRRDGWRPRRRSPTPSSFSRAPSRRSRPA